MAIFKQITAPLAVAASLVFTPAVAQDDEHLPENTTNLLECVGTEARTDLEKQVQDVVASFKPTEFMVAELLVDPVFYEQTCVPSVLGLQSSEIPTGAKEYAAFLTENFDMAAYATGKETVLNEAQNFATELLMQKVMEKIMAPNPRDLPRNEPRAPADSI